MGDRQEAPWALGPSVLPVTCEMKAPRLGASETQPMRGQVCTGWGRGALTAPGGHFGGRVLGG